MNEDLYHQVANIKVFGIGGAGCNAINRMVDEGLQGVEFFVCNTDVQVLNVSMVKNKIILLSRKHIAEPARLSRSSYGGI